MDDSGAVERHILARLGISTLAVAEQLVILLKRFRAAQLRDLDDALAALPSHVVAHIEAHFDRKLDVKDELERYAQDFLKLIHLMRHLQIGEATRREIETLMGALGDGGDRALLVKMVQALGARLVHVLSAFCVRLPQVRLQQDFYRIFAASDNGVGELKTWMQWLDSVRDDADCVTEFFVKCATERCLALWLKLLTVVPSPSRAAVIKRLAKAEAVVVKQIGRFHDVTALSVAKQLELCETLLNEQAVLLSEFSTATMLVLYAKFNSDRLVASVIKALYLAGKIEVTGLIESLALEENLRAIESFVVGVVEFEKCRDAMSLFLSSPRLTQSRIVALSLIATTSETEHNGTSVVFHLLLDGRLRSIEEALRKLLMMSTDRVTALFKAITVYSVDDLALLGEGIEMILDVACLDIFVRLFDSMLPMQRPMLVDWVLDVPGNEALPLYNKLVELYANAGSDNAANLLQMMASLSKGDKHLLCSQLLRRSVGNGDNTNDAILRFLSTCEQSRRHNCIKLLSSTESDTHGTLLYLLRTQRIPEQAALTKMMLKLTPSANHRLLAKIRDLDGDLQDEFFQLLMLIPKVEYKIFSRLLVSEEVNAHQLEKLVHVAANLMNQAASREMVSFASELAPRYRNMFFDILSQCSPTEKGVVMRIVACSARLPPDVAQLLVEQLLRVPWETRSALVEQVRALEDSSHIQTYVDVLRCFDSDVWLPTMVHLLNLLPLPVRISLVLLFSQIRLLAERVQVLTRLNAMRKDLMPRYCTSLCDPAFLPVISGSFLRVFAYLQEQYQTSMLKLLQRRSCWVFVEALTTAIDANKGIPGISRRSQTDSTSLVNGMAASLTLLQREDDFVLLADVVEDAMDNGIGLDELIVVFAQFRNRDRLIALLRYVAHLTRFTPSTLFFRVLAGSPVTAFLFDMCHVLDLDDAIFALKRLERMRVRDHEALDRLLVTIASRGGAAECRDEFCHFILGYQERKATGGAIRTKRINTVIYPKRFSKCLLAGEAPVAQVSVWEQNILAICERELDYSTATASVRPIPIEKQLHGIRRKREEPRRHRRHRNWREWTASDWDDILSPNGDDSSTVHSLTSIESALEDLSHECLERLKVETDPCVTNEMHPSSNPSPSVVPTPLVQENAHSNATADTKPPTSLPPIRLMFDAATTIAQPLSSDSVRSMPSIPTPVGGLVRSESASSGLNPAATRSKMYRGLQAALDLEDIGEYHAPRNRGVSIFHKQCEYQSLHEPSRIRVARTELANAKVLAARVDHALGRRTPAPVAPLRSSLERSDLLTVEQATLALAHGQRARAARVGEVKCVVRCGGLG